MSNHWSELSPLHQAAMVGNNALSSHGHTFICHPQAFFCRSAPDALFCCQGTSSCSICTHVVCYTSLLGGQTRICTSPPPQSHSRYYKLVCPDLPSSLLSSQFAFPTWAVCSEQHGVHAQLLSFLQHGESSCDTSQNQPKILFQNLFLLALGCDMFSLLTSQLV